MSWCTEIVSRVVGQLIRLWYVLTKRRKKKIGEKTCSGCKNDELVVGDSGFQTCFRGTISNLVASYGNNIRSLAVNNRLGLEDFYSFRLGSKN